MEGRCGETISFEPGISPSGRDHYCLDTAPEDTKGGWIVIADCDRSISQRWFF